jgi:hypothetical protein
MHKSGVRCDFIGRTPRYWDIPDSHGLQDTHRAVRGYEIARWLHHAKTVRNVNIESFTILDDDNDMACLLPYLVRTDTYKGIQYQQVIDAVEMLLCPVKL